MQPSTPLPSLLKSFIIQKIRKYSSKSHWKTTTKTPAAGIQSPPFMATDQEALALRSDIDHETDDLHFNTRSFLFSFAFFSILIALVLCFIYSLYVCAYRWQLGLDHTMAPWVRPTSDQSSPANGAAVPRIGMGTTAGRGLDPIVMNSLPIVSFGSSSTGSGECKEVDCAICLCGFQGGEKVKVLPDCDHAFHSECLDGWLATRSSCPLCRAPVK